MPTTPTTTITTTTTTTMDIHGHLLVGMSVGMYVESWHTICRIHRVKLQFKVVGTFICSKRVSIKYHVDLIYTTSISSTVG